MKYLLSSLIFVVFSGSISANTIQLQLQEKIEQAQKHLTITEEYTTHEQA